MNFDCRIPEKVAEIRMLMQMFVLITEEHMRPSDNTDREGL